MNPNCKKPHLYNPCIVKIYKGIKVVGNNYIKLQEMNANDLQRLLKMQKKT